MWRHTDPDLQFVRRQRPRTGPGPHDPPFPGPYPDPDEPPRFPPPPNGWQPTIPYPSDRPWE
eukprot:2872017-Pleurochrysis_carterae.AAC.1